MKSVEQRIAECISIRQQLQEYGIFSVPDVATKLTKYMNIFITDGASQTFVLKPRIESIEFKVILTCTEGKQSGVQMIR